MKDSGCSSFYFRHAFEATKEQVYNALTNIWNFCHFSKLWKMKIDVSY